MANFNRIGAFWNHSFDSLSKEIIYFIISYSDRCWKKLTGTKNMLKLNQKYFFLFKGERGVCLWTVQFWWQIEIDCCCLELEIFGRWNVAFSCRWVFLENLFSEWRILGCSNSESYVTFLEVSCIEMSMFKLIWW